MIPSEAAQLLAFEATVSQRTVSELDAKAWARALFDVSLDDAVEAVTSLWRRSNARMTPFDVLVEVRRIRGDRLDRVVEDVPDADPDDVSAWLAALRAGRVRVADGTVRERPVAALLAGAAARGAIPGA